MKMSPVQDVRQWFPSDDGNEQDRMQLMKLMEQLMTGFDLLKDPERVNLKGSKDRSGDFYGQLNESSVIPPQGKAMEDVTRGLIELMHAHPYHTKYFMTNILPMASIPGIMGMLAAMLVNGNNLWDVYGPAGAEAEVRVVSMMSKLVGYDHTRSGGYTTWGGQGAIFTGLRLAIVKFAPDASRTGVPNNLYAFCSDSAHYSLYKSMEATGLGSDRLVKIRTRSDSSMDTADLKWKLEQVIRSGGVPIYIVATTGTTDAMGIDDISEIMNIAVQAAAANGLNRPHIHADSALGGFFAFFNDYDFALNPLALDMETLGALHAIAGKMKHIHLADTMCFDFQKLGQTPYLTSLLLVKEAESLRLLDLNPDETPYVGYRGYGQYHTGYTLECSRMASSISIYSALLAFGIEGYQQLLAQFVSVNLAFRRQLMKEVPEMVIANPDNPGITTLLRIYENRISRFQEELAGECPLDELLRNNRLNERLFELLGERRDEMFFGDTKKHLLVLSQEGVEVPLYASKLFVISPYTQLEHVPAIVGYLKERVDEIYEQYHSPYQSGRSVEVV
ncbi:pyridoxal phosphate-dependent decarboxylase family protein [Paenibacillus sepulcri]|uniref:Aspartate aminotransferase family protein n=1 Tax=Paenibacillus sepulcri TaxID=359917 RepID=A0ABS7BZQ0_9BACL|nr:aspartate aminotransferase family protein [Paenibacillus sepulcri]